MQIVKVVFIYTLSDPGKLFMVCNMDESEDFMDPLILFSQPEYDIYNVNKEGLYAIGGNVSVDLLLKSYKWGIFPWFPFRDSENPQWYCPRQRFVIFPEKIHIGHSLRNLLNKNKYHITINREFRKVIHYCRKVNERDENEMAWLGDSIEKLFIELHELGYAKSVELWEEDNLVGGFYGFWNKGVFQGESMFSLRPSASQIALILFCRDNKVEGKKIKFIDTQFETPTFKKLGGEYISYEDYRDLLDAEE